MNDVQKTDLNSEIARLLLEGQSHELISKVLSCEVLAVKRVLSSKDFSVKCAEVVENSLKSAALGAVYNLIDIAGDESASNNARIRANEIILSKALEYSDLQGAETPASEMTQAQLIERLNTLQKEAAERAKPIDTVSYTHLTLPTNRKV